MLDAAIIGAGISGLTAAHELRKRGRTVEVYERASRCGGTIQTFQKSGYRLELGPNSLMLRDSGRELLRELGLSAESIASEKRTRFVSLPAGISEELFPVNLRSIFGGKILSSGAKARLLAEPFKAKCRSEDLSVHEFISGRLGSEAAERLAAPFFNGVYAADIRNLSARSALGSAWALEQKYGSIFLGALITAFCKERPSSSEMVNFSGGMSALVNALAGSLGDIVRLNSEVSSLSPASEGVEVFHSAGSTVAKRVIITSESLSAARLILPLDAPLARQISDIPYSPVGVLYLSCAADQLDKRFQGVGFLRQPKHEDALLGVLFSSVMFPATAPAEKALLTCFVGGSLNPALSDAEAPEVQLQAVTKVRELLSIEGNIEIIHAHTWKRAIPNYPVGHFAVEESVKRLEEKHPGISVIGNWISRPGVADCIERGINAARE